MSDDDVSVRVAVRIRPLIPREIINMCRICAQVTPGEPQITLGSNKAFTYDYVFETHEGQETVYDTCVQSLVNGVLEGYNATVLAYGQTGSGKTYTMGTGFDVEVDYDQIGIIPRAIRNLFDNVTNRIQQAKDQGQIPPEFKIGVQFMELYNEDIRDLFNPIQAYEKSKEYKIHEDPKLGIYVKGITLKPVMSAEDALQCLKLGALSRTTASTQMNTESSRSHAIFTLLIKQQRLVVVDNEMGPAGDASEEQMTEFETLTAKFHFVDLAGSERLKRTCATGERAKEGISINYGLLALGNVISALGDVTKKATHVPYRDSKLTRLLQDSLGGNSQTVMIACISPSDSDFMETLNTLKYANRARNIQNRIMVNQDKGSRTISILRQQIAKLELELFEYKQGKRIVGEDGIEVVNDMFYENNMLQSELNNLRTRVKAMQETIDALSAKNTALLAEKATGNWIGGSSDSDVTAIIQDYLKEIEDLRAKLMESNFTCEQLRKSAVRAQENYNRNIMNSSIIDPLVDTQLVIEEAKKDLRREKEILERNKHNDDVGEDNAESSESDSDSDSDTDSEGSTKEMRGELAILNNNIQDKEALINQLESLQNRLHIMRQQYEEKLLQLQARIKITQEERDKVLQSFTGQNTEPTEKVKRIKDDYERKLKEMQKELKILQTAKKEHQRLLRTQNDNEKQLRDLRNGLDELKRSKVKVMQKMKEESQRHRLTDTRRIREIESLKKEARRNANVIKSMEADKRIKEQVLRRKQEEVSALRRETKRGLSRRAAGRVVHGKKKSARELKNKWIVIENKVTKATMVKKTMVDQEQKMDKLLRQRERLNRDLERNREKMSQYIAIGQDCIDIKNLIDDLSANIVFVNESIKELQSLIVQEEEAPVNEETDEITDVLQTIYDIDDARFLLQKLFTMTVNQSFEVERKNIEIGKKEEVIKQIKDDKHMCSQLLEHMIHSDFSLFSNNMITSMSSNANESDDSTNSSRSESPVQTGGHSEDKKTVPIKVRRRTALPSELLFGSQKSEANDNVMTQSQDATTLREDHPIVRVPSAPGSLKGLIPLPKSVERNMYMSQTPRPVHRIPLPIHSTKHGSMEQGLDWDSASPPASPMANRKMTVSRDDNVFSRLFSTNQTESATQRGNIIPYAGKSQLKASLQCIALAKGHNNAVLSVYATDDTLFTGAADRIVKVWDLQTNCEIHTLHGHPSNVVSVRYNPTTQLLLSASLSYIKVWDLRFSNVRCVKVLCSSGMTQAGTSLSVVSSNRTVQIPLGECQVNDVAFNTSGSLIFAAASDKVRIWDTRKFAYIGKLSTDHRAPVMCLAVDKINSNNDMVVTGSKDHFIKVFSISSMGKGNFAPTVNLEPPHYDGIQCLAVGKDVLFSGSRDMCIKKWDLNKQELVQSLNNAHRGWICGMALIREDRLLLSGCRSGFIKLWDAHTCDQLADVRAHSTSVNAIATNSNNIFTASNCGEVKIWKHAEL